MHLSQSVVLWQGRVGIQKIGVFGKTPSPYYGKNSSNKQREMTVHHYFKIWRSANQEHFKNFKRFFKCSHKNHQDIWWNCLSCRPPQERKTQSLPAAEDKFIRVTSLRNCSRNKYYRVQVTDTSQHQLFRGDCVNQAFMVELLQSNHY
jgi:hypothetical protein